MLEKNIWKQHIQFVGLLPSFKLAWKRSMEARKKLDDLRVEGERNLY